MRIAPLVLAVAALAAAVQPAQAQSSQRQDQRPGGQSRADDQQTGERARAPRIAPLRRGAAAGPCPFVKILYEGARYVEMSGDAPSASTVGFTGEIQGVNADCGYQSDEPITVDMNVLFDLGRGPMAEGDQRTYRYWVAVTERNSAVLAKEYFDLPVDFDGQRTAQVNEGRTVVIPRAGATTSGSNFEILIGFDVTPQMVEFNRSGSRFRINAGTQAAAAPAPAPASTQ